MTVFNPETIDIIGRKKDGLPFMGMSEHRDWGKNEDDLMLTQVIIKESRYRQYAESSEFKEEYGNKYGIIYVCGTVPSEEALKYFKENGIDFDQFKGKEEPGSCHSKQPKKGFFQKLFK